MSPRHLPRGFRRVFSYVMGRHGPEHTRVLDPELWEQSGVVYARTYRGKVVYIGSTDGRLCRRINRHVNSIDTSMRATAPRYREWAKKNHKHIIIKAYRPPPATRLGRHIAMHRAIEAALINEFKRPGAKDWFVDRC